MIAIAQIHLYVGGNFTQVICKKSFFFLFIFLGGTTALSLQIIQLNPTTIWENFPNTFINIWFENMLPEIFCSGTILLKIFQRAYVQNHIHVFGKILPDCSHSRL